MIIRLSEISREFKGLNIPLKNAIINLYSQITLENRMLQYLSKLSKLSKEELQKLTQTEKNDYSNKIGFPVELFDRLIANQTSKHHFQQKCQYGQHAPKGEHPNAFALIKDSSYLSLTSTTEEQLRTKRIEEQIRALTKEYFYKQLEKAIKEVWSNMVDWRNQNHSLVGTVKEVINDKNQPVMTLTTLSENKEVLLKNSPSIEAVLCQLIHYSRSTWGAAIMQWSASAFSNGKYDRLVPKILIPSKSKVYFEEILWRGVNTAIKILFSINSLLLHFSKSNISEAQWIKLQQHNYSFAALLAGTSLSTFEPLEHKLIKSPNTETIDYMCSNGIISKASDTPQRTGFEMLDPGYFSLKGQSSECASLDLSTEQLPYIKKLPLLGDVILKKCPALKIGVVKEMYQWVNDLCNHHLKQANKFPWQN